MSSLSVTVAEIRWVMKMMLISHSSFRFYFDLNELLKTITTQRMKFFTSEFFNKCDQMRRKMRIWSHLLKKFVMENFIFLCNE